MQTNLATRLNENDYTTITETPSNKASQEQIARLYTRYKFASEFCKDKDVLEIACGAGVGLGYLANYARKVVGCDIDDGNLSVALKTYSGHQNIEVLPPLDAHNLPFKDNSFDVVILHEAIYYLSQPEKFIEGAYRVLRKDGALIIGSANKEWSDFNPSPYSYRYFTASELYHLLISKGFDVELFADCPINRGGFKGVVVSLIKRVAVKLHLIPKTMKGKERLKRLFFGELTTLPAEITDDLGFKYTRPAQIPHDRPITQYKVLFAVAHVKKGLLTW